MSQSPISDFSEAGTLRYRQGWRALNRLLHENRSFSGNEKHCAFLNCGPGQAGQHNRFADVSAAIGFNLPDDGRGLAFVDWDFDGDLDVWTTSRTAPRVRFLRNGNKSGHKFVAFQLRGNGRTTNADAIGARVELYVEGQKTPHIRTVHAGQSFLSQSSRWIHFGLGQAKSLDKVVVRWPGGKREEFADIIPNSYYFLRQDLGVVMDWKPPARKTRITLTPSEPEVKPVSGRARIVVPPGMVLPTLWTRGAENEDPIPYERENKKGLFLVNLWASYCLPCVEELTEWGHEAEEFRKRGIEVVALNTDGVMDTEGAHERALKTIERIKFSLPWAEADPLTVRNLDGFTNAVLDLWIPLPVPSSFLVDERGEVVVIYKGPVSAKQVFKDVALAKATPEARRAAMVPFPGIWVDKPTTADSLRVASQLLDRAESASAVRYLKTLVSALEPRAVDDAGKREFGDALQFLGVLLDEFGQPKEARDYLEKARAAIPNDIRIRMTLAGVYEKLNELAKATSETSAAIRINSNNLDLHDRLAALYAAQKLYDKSASRYRMVLKVQPKRAPTRYRLAQVLLQGEKAAEAITELKQTLRHSPRFFEAANTLAHILSAHPDQKIRSAQEAFVLSSRLCQVTRYKNPRFLDTRATAAAGFKKFDQALKSGDQALALYQADQRYAEHAQALEKRLALFRENKPWIDSSLSNKSSQKTTP